MVAILGLQDSIFSVVLVYPSMTIPFSVWLLMGFFKSIPKELEECPADPYVSALLELRRG